MSLLLRLTSVGLLIACVAVTGCGRSSSKKGSLPAGVDSPAKTEEAQAVRRINPGFIQQLERQSMLASSVEMAKIVSGSEIAWRSGASVGTSNDLLGYADTWVQVHPLTLLGDSRRTAFAQLNTGAAKTVMRELGAKGIYVAPIGGSGALWGQADKGLTSGEDVVQYSFSQAAGKDTDYKRLMGSLLETNNLLGSDLVPAATGLGPDFFLAARNLREYPGIYCMVDVPKEMWGSLPAVKEEFAVTALSQEQVTALSQQKLLPQAMRDESSPFSRQTGWAVTGEVNGIDGNKRRWVYRYYQSPHFAVLNWDDPSQAAHRILSGSAVRQVGMLGQAFVGLKFEAFQGLEPATAGGSVANSFSVEPALTAAQAISRQIRKYGGFSWLRDDDLTLQAMNDFLRSGTDFVFDSAFSPAAEHALLTGDATLLNFMADEVLRLNIATNRLVHSMPAQDGINYTLPHINYLIATQNDATAKALKASVLAQVNGMPLFKEGFLYTTGAGLAASAMGGDTTKIAELTKGHLLLAFFKAMQPGVLMLSGQDLAGAMPLAGGKVEDAARGAYALTAEASSLVVTGAGMPKTQTVYPPSDSQVHEKTSFVKSVGNYVKKRNAVGLAKGSLVAHPQTKNKGVIALISQLPQGDGFVVTVCNFGKTAVSESISLSGVSASATGRASVLAGEGGSYSINGSTMSVQLGPWQGKSLILGKGASTVKSDASAQGKNKEETSEVAKPEVSAPKEPVKAAPTTVEPIKGEDASAKAEPTKTAPVKAEPTSAQDAPAQPAPATSPQ